MEHWKDVPGTGGRLMVSDIGNVRSYLRDKANGNNLRPTADKKGYMRLHVTLDRQRVSYKVHRLVAEAFIENKDGKEHVNHIDGDKRNNRASNLEWSTNLENARHAINNGLWDNVFEASRRTNEARKVSVIATSAETGEVLMFDSVSDAEKHFNSRHISAVLNGKRAKAKGYYFERGGE